MTFYRSSWIESPESGRRCWQDLKICKTGGKHSKSDLDEKKQEPLTFAGSLGWCTRHVGSELSAQLTVAPLRPGTGEANPFQLLSIQNLKKIFKNILPQKAPKTIY